MVNGRTYKYSIHYCNGDVETIEHYDDDVVEFRAYKDKSVFYVEKHVPCKDGRTWPMRLFNRDYYYWWPTPDAEIMIPGERYI